MLDSAQIRNFQSVLCYYHTNKSLLNFYKSELSPFKKKISLNIIEKQVQKVHKSSLDLILFIEQKNNSLLFHQCFSLVNKYELIYLNNELQSRHFVFYCDPVLV